MGCEDDAGEEENLNGGGLRTRDRTQRTRIPVLYSYACAEHPWQTSREPSAPTPTVRLLTVARACLRRAVRVDARYRLACKPYRCAGQRA